MVLFRRVDVLRRFEQLALDLPVRVAMEREDLFVTQSNSEAVTLIDLWPDWPTHAVLVLGAAGSGKTHLAHVFAARSGARIVPAKTVTIGAVPKLLTQDAIVIEDLVPGHVDNAALFHLINLAKETSKHIVFTSAYGVEQLGLTLPDLISRMRSFPSVRIHEPDDTLLRAVIVKHFIDRQLRISDDIVTFLVSRIPRSLGHARAIAAEIDRSALVQKAEITRPFVSRVVKSLENQALPGADQAS
jgi:chromosomal replication initiation ATPase DnaA